MKVNRQKEVKQYRRERSLRCHGLLYDLKEQGIGHSYKVKTMLTKNLKPQTKLPRVIAKDCCSHGLSQINFYLISVEGVIFRPSIVTSWITGSFSLTTSGISISITPPKMQDSYMQHLAGKASAATFVFHLDEAGSKIVFVKTLPLRL